MAVPFEPQMVAGQVKTEESVRAVGKLAQLVQLHAEIREADGLKSLLCLVAVVHLVHWPHAIVGVAASPAVLFL